MNVFFSANTRVKLSLWTLTLKEYLDFLMLHVRLQRENFEFSILATLVRDVINPAPIYYIQVGCIE